MTTEVCGSLQMQSVGICSTPAFLVWETVSLHELCSRIRRSLCLPLKSHPWLAVSLRGLWLLHGTSDNVTVYVGFKYTVLSVKNVGWMRKETTFPWSGASLGPLESR